MNEEENRSLNFKEGKRKREELYLERIYYIAVDPFREDSWINVLGEKAFISWLKFQTLVNRKEDAMETYGNLNTVPRSIDNLAKVLKMSKKTLYNQVLKVLWNYGFIDFEEWKEQKKVGQKAINVIVYPYPQNDIDLQYKPLEKVRDYDTEYSSNAKTYNNPKNKVKRTDKQIELDLDNEYEAYWAHKILIEHLENLGIKSNIVAEIQFELSHFPTTIIPIKIMEDQLNHMQAKLEAGGEIFDFAKYFVGGVISRVELSESITQSKEAINAAMEKRTNINLNKVVMYNWLEERE